MWSPHREVVALQLQQPGVGHSAPGILQLANHTISRAFVHRKQSLLACQAIDHVYVSEGFFVQPPGVCDCAPCPAHVPPDPQRQECDSLKHGLDPACEPDPLLAVVCVEEHPLAVPPHSHGRSESVCLREQQHLKVSGCGKLSPPLRNEDILLRAASIATDLNGLLCIVVLLHQLVPFGTLTSISTRPSSIALLNVPASRRAFRRDSLLTGHVM